MIGVVVMIGAFVGPYIRKLTPRAAMLGTLAGISITFISMRPAAQMWEAAWIGLPVMAIILIGFFTNVKLPFGIPVGLAALQGVARTIPKEGSTLEPIIFEEQPLGTAGSVRLASSVLDEALSLWRTVWEDDPASFHGGSVDFDELRVLPQPAHRIPFWVGGGGPRAERRAVEHGDGFHFIGMTPEQHAEPIRRLRTRRPEPEFVMSLRTGWDPQGMDPDLIRSEREAYEEAGVAYVVSAPWRSDLDAWLRGMELLAGLLELTPL